MKADNFYPEIYNDPAQLTEKTKQKKNAVSAPPVNHTDLICLIYHSCVFKVQLFAIFDFGR